MIFNFTSVKKALAISLLGGFATTGADAWTLETIREVRFSDDFFRELKYSNVHVDQFKIFFTTSPDSAVFPKELGHFPRGTIRGHSAVIEGHSSVDLDFSKSDTLDLFYYFVSDNIIREKASTKITKEDLENGVEINPLEGCKKVILKSALGVDGTATATHYVFSPLEPIEYKSLYITDWDRHSITLKPQTDDPMEVERLTSAFWTEPGREVMYALAAEGPYLLLNKRYKMPDAAQPDTLSADFREAKMVKFSVNDMEGKTMDIRNLLIPGENDINSCYFQSKFGSGHQLMQKGEITLVHPTLFDNDKINLEEPVKSLNLYGFPGDYIFSFWAYPNEHLANMPRGLEGLLTVKDQEEEQQVTFDYSKYLTVKLKSNLDDFGYSAHDYWFRYPSRQPQDNGLLDTFLFDEKHRMSDAYTRLDYDVNGQTNVRIWPAVGSEMADIAGKISGSDASFSTKDVDLNKVKELTITLPDLFRVRTVFPKLIKNYIWKVEMDGDGIGISRNTKSKTPNYTPEDLLLTDTMDFYRTQGSHQVNFEINGEINNKYFNYSSDQKEFVVSGKEEITEVNLPWNRAVILEQQTPDFVESMETTVPGLTLVETALTGDSIYKEKLVVFDEEGEQTYKVTAPFYMEQTYSFNVDKELSRVKVELEEENLTLINKLGKSGFIKIEPLTFTYEDGTVKTFEGDIFYENPFKFYTFPGKLVAEAYYNKMGMRQSQPIYTMTFDTNHDNEMDLCNWGSSVTFVRDTVELDLAEVGYSEQPKGVKLYFLGSPNIDAKTPIKMKIGRTKNSAGLFSGKYCAEDSLGNKVYFEVPADQRVRMTIDFDNPPVPPTGIETAEGAVAHPVVYYDLTGRKLVAPRKGVMLVRMSNGKVVKMIKK